MLCFSGERRVFVMSRDVWEASNVRDRPGKNIRTSAHFFLNLSLCSTPSVQQEAAVDLYVRIQPVHFNKVNTLVSKVRPVSYFLISSCHNVPFTSCHKLGQNNEIMEEINCGVPQMDYQDLPQLMIHLQSTVQKEEKCSRNILAFCSFYLYICNRLQARFNIQGPFRNTLSFVFIDIVKNQKAIKSVKWHEKTQGTHILIKCVECTVWKLHECQHQWMSMSK